MRKWVWIGCGVVVLLILGVVLLFVHTMQEVERHIRVGKETTFVSGPVDGGGYVNYVAAVNAEFSAGVTRENNAAVVLVRATGIKAVMPKARGAWLSGLGMKEGEVPERGFWQLWEVMPARKGEPEQERMSRASDDEDNRVKEAWKGADDEVAAEWVKRNEGALEHLKEGALRERFFEPLVDGSGMGCLIDAEIPALGEKRELGRVLAARAMMRLGEGDKAGWMEDVVTLERYGRLLMQAPTVAQRLAGMSVLNEADKCVGAGMGKLKGEDARQLLTELRGLSKVPELAEALDKTERLLPLGELSAMAKYGTAYVSGHGGGSAPPAGGVLGDGLYPVNFAVCMRNSNRLLDMQVAAMRERTFVGMKGAFYAVDVEEKRLSKLGVMSYGSKESLAADMIVTLFYYPFSKAAEIERASRVLREITEIGLILEIDREKNGAYAEKLGDLPRGEMKRLGEDFFSGGELIYRREGKGYVLYSVGRNERDDGGVREESKSGMQGSTPSSTTRKDDVVLRVME